MEPQVEKIDGDVLLDAIPEAMQKSIIALIQKTVEKEVAAKTAELSEQIKKLTEQLESKQKSGAATSRTGPS